MRPGSLPLRFAATIAALSLSANAALAHHPMGNQLPSTLLEGFLSGLGHPVIGVDHLAAVVAVGALASFIPRGGVPLAFYVLAMIAGATLQINKTEIPGAEILVGASVFFLGILLIARKPLSAIPAGLLFGIVGFLHGYVLGESIVGAEQTPLFAYFAGLTIIQLTIGLAAMVAARWIANRKLAFDAFRITGVGIAGLGLVLLIQLLPS